MRILFMTQVLPLPLDAGPKVRAYHVLRYLAEAGHEIDLLSFVRAGESLEHIESLRQICSTVETVPMTRSRLRDIRDGARSMLMGAPFLVLRDQVEPMWDALRRMAGNRSYDALHVDQLWMAPYGLDGVDPGLRVLDQHNAVFMIPRRLAEQESNRVIKTLLRHESTKLEGFERDACRRFDHVVWVTEEDRRALVSEDRGMRDTVIPIAVDPTENALIRRPQPFRVTFLGGMHWPPNLEGAEWFGRVVWPKIASAVPSAVLTVIGKQPTGKLLQLQKAPRVEITGYVRDLHRYLAETAAFIVPLHSGAGMRVKILDAWSWGLPVISTTLGAAGLKAQDGENILIVDDPERFAAQVVQVIQHPRFAQRLADNGRATVETHYDWRRIYQAWDQVYHS